MKGKIPILTHKLLVEKLNGNLLAYDVIKENKQEALYKLTQGYSQYLCKKPLIERVLVKAG